MIKKGLVLIAAMSFLFCLINNSEASTCDISFEVINQSTNRPISGANIIVSGFVSEEAVPKVNAITNANGKAFARLSSPFFFPGVNVYINARGYTIFKKYYQGTGHKDLLVGLRQILVPRP